MASQYHIASIQSKTSFVRLKFDRLPRLALVHVKFEGTGCLDGGCAVRFVGSVLRLVVASLYFHRSAFTCRWNLFLHSNGGRMLSFLGPLINYGNQGLGPQR